MKIQEKRTRRRLCKSYGAGGILRNTKIVKYLI